jgi:hypothetical protein
MTEPILHLTEKKDSLDIMLEMNMDNLLKHPVIVEVLNLSNEGKFSADDSLINLIPTLSFFFNNNTLDSHSIHDRLVQNIVSIGKGGGQGKKKSTLQFNIWKQSIAQR